MFQLHSFSTPRKYQKRLLFSDDLRGQRKGALRTNGLKAVKNCRGLGKRCRTTLRVWVWPHLKILKCWLSLSVCIWSKTKIIIRFQLISSHLLINLENIIIFIKNAFQLHIIPLSFKQNFSNVSIKFVNTKRIRNNTSIKK